MRRMEARGLTMTTLVLCRHGETEGNVERRFGGHGSTRLTERGRAQARAAGVALARLGVDVLYTSDLARAVETAAFIGRAAGVAPELTPALRERSVGDLTGLTFAEAEAKFPLDFAALLQRDPDARPPGGETYRECRERAVAFVERAVANHPDRTVVIVSHNITVCELVAHFLELEDEAPSSSASRIDNCGLHFLERARNGSWIPRSLNDCRHLGTI